MSQRRVLWDPLKSSRFLISGSSELRLYEWNDQSGPDARFDTIAASTELGQLRAFDWSVDPSRIVACGLTTGRTTLVQLEHDHDNHRQSQSINVRHSRPANAVAFGPDSHSNWLAVGLDKGRSESLQVFDIESAARPSRSPAHLSASTQTIMSEPHPIFSAGASEAVTSAAWLPTSASPLLVAGMSAKWVRVFDPRSPTSSSAVTSWGTRAMLDLSPNPFDGHQFAAHGDDGIVRVFDLRRPMEHQLAFHEGEAGAVPHRSRTPGMPKPLSQIGWSPTRRGVITTLERDSNALRVWYLADGPSAKLDGEGHANTEWQHSHHPQADPLRLPVLLGDERPRFFEHALTSFAFALPSSSSSSSATTHFLGASRDTNPGSSGHSLQLITLRHHQPTALYEKGVVTADEHQPAGVKAWPVPAGAGTLVGGVDEGEVSDGALLGSPVEVEVDLSARGRKLSLNSVVSMIDRNETPRPGGSVTPRGVPRVRQDEIGVVEEEEPVLGMGALNSDMSLLTRSRVDRGYGPDALINAAVEPHGGLAAFWQWIARAEGLLPTSSSQDHDFRYRGVLPLLRGFAANNATQIPSASSSPVVGPSHGPPHRSHAADVRRTIKRGEEARARDVAHTAYARAAAALVSARRVEHLYAVGGSTMVAERKLALQSCGADWDEDWAEVCERYAARKEFEGAARHAFLCGHLQETMAFLSRCRNDRLRLLAPLVAAFLAQGEDKRGADSDFGRMCQGLASSAEFPWIRALLNFCQTNDRQDIIDEGGLPLNDRVAITLLYKPDSSLISELESMGRSALRDGDLSAVVLFGLRDGGLDLVQTYVDKTADCQTAALAAAFVHPGVVRSDLRLRRWIETYRLQLDGLQLFGPRALMDCARGKRARSAAEEARRAGRKAEARELGEVLRKEQKAQILVKCQFCGTVIGKDGGAGERAERAGTVKSTLCPSCSKGLPGCSVCLAKPSVHSVAEGSASLAWCQRCRHGGHVGHLLDWFQRSRACPVAGCECECQSEE